MARRKLDKLGVVEARAKAEKAFEDELDQASTENGVKLIEAMFGRNGLIRWASLKTTLGLDEPLNLKSDQLKAPLEAFREALASIAMLLHVPRMFFACASISVDMMTGVFLGKWISNSFKEMVKTQVLLNAKGNRATVRKNFKTIEASIEKDFESDDEKLVTKSLEKAIESSKQTIDTFMKHDLAKQWHQAHLASVLVRTWTAIETLVADAWVCVLNSKSKELAESAFRAMEAGDEGEDGISRKSIQIWQLARWDLSLDGKLGSALKPKFDFSSVSGMRAALNVIDRNVDWMALGHDGKALHKLEALRHLIVHRGGKVDETFVRRTGSSTPLDTVIELSEKDIDDAVIEVVVLGKSIMSKLDDFLTGEVREGS